MNTFIIGATGYIGRAITKHLLKNGNRVTALVRSDEAAAKLPKGDISILRGDLSKLDVVRQGVKSADAVIYLAIAGLKGPSPEDTAAIEAIIEGLAGTNKPFIVTSGIAIYVGSKAPEIDEDTPLTDVIPAQAWRVTLESMVTKAASRGVRAIVLRPALVYGAGSASAVVLSPLKYAREQKKAVHIGPGANVVPLVHVDDLAAAYQLALEKAPAGTALNIIGNYLTGKDIARAISHATGLGGKTVSLTMDEAKEALGPLAPATAMDLKISTARAVHMLGWSPTGPSLVYELIHGSLR